MLHRFYRVLTIEHPACIRVQSVNMFVFFSERFRAHLLIIIKLVFAYLSFVSGSTGLLIDFFNCYLL